MSGRGIRPAAAAFVALLAACDNGGAGANNAAANGQGPTPPAAPPPQAQAQALRPGQWEVTSRIVSFEPLQASPETEARLRAQPIPPPEVELQCLTPQQTTDPIRAFRDLTIQGQPGMTCGDGEGTFADGRIRFTLVCRTAEEGEVRQAVVGSYSAERLQYAVSADMTGPAQATGETVRIRVESTLSSRRVGECPAGTAAN